VTLPAGWKTQNPFGSHLLRRASDGGRDVHRRSGALVHRAERRAGVLAGDGHLRPVHQEATSKASFVFSDGAGMRAAIDQAVRTGEPVVFTARSIRNATGRRAGGRVSPSNGASGSAPDQAFASGPTRRDSRSTPSRTMSLARSITAATVPATRFSGRLVRGPRMRAGGGDLLRLLDPVAQLEQEVVAEQPPGLGEQLFLFFPRLMAHALHQDLDPWRRTARLPASSFPARRASISPRGAPRATRGPCRGFLEGAHVGLHRPRSSRPGRRASPPRPRGWRAPG